MNTTYLVIGAGMMGSATAFDLTSSSPEVEVILADIDFDRATQSAAAISPVVKPLRLDVNIQEDLKTALEGCTVVISAVSYAVNYDLTRAALQAGVHMCDLGGNNDVVEKQLKLHKDAESRGVTIIPNCGLAPGLINILAMDGAKDFDTLDSVSLRVGGLPQHPRPPLNYQIVFSVEGLINEYVEKALVIRNGKRILIDSMSEIEKIEFSELGTLEAFSTSGGLSTLVDTLDGRVRNLDYKTIRYPGHCEKFKTLLDLGFAGNEPIVMGGSVKTSRELFAELLLRKLDHGEPDLVLARATLTGQTGSVVKTLVYECVDYYDTATKITAMMRTTAFPTSITAQMLAGGDIRRRGVLPPEECVPGDRMIDALAKRNVKITKRVTEMGR